MLCHAGDRCAGWLADGLAARGAAVEVVTAEQLVGAPRIVHRIGATGIDLDVDLADGRRLSARTLSAVVNRIEHVPVHLLGITAGDVDYATQELHAIWLSWLSGLPCRVVNRPSAMSLSGPHLSVAQWLLQAGRCGLPVAPVRLHAGPVELPPHETTVIVAAGSVFGPPGGEALAGGATALARSVGAELLELHVARDERGLLVVTGASTVPDLRPGGARLLDHLRAVLA